MTRTTNQPHNSFFSSTLKTAALLSVALGSTQFTNQASAQDHPCHTTYLGSISSSPAPRMWLAHVCVTTNNRTGHSVTLDGSGVIVSPHAMLLPASMLYHGDWAHPADLKNDEWIGSKSEYTITPDATIFDDPEYPDSNGIHAPYGTRTPSRRVVSNDFITRGGCRYKNNWGALQFDCPFEGLGTGMPVTFTTNDHLITVGGYLTIGSYHRYFSPASLRTGGIFYPYSKRILEAENAFNLTHALSGAGAWKTFGDIDFGTGQVELDYGLVGLFTSAYSRPNSCSDCCRAVGPRFAEVGNRADSIREIMRWTPEEDCDMPIAMPWHLLREHVRNQQPEMLIPLEQLNLSPEVDGQFDQHISRTMQVIEHTFYEWLVYAEQPEDPMSPRAIRMIAPENRWLSVEEAQALISASLNWANLNPPVLNPIDIEIDPTIPTFNTMAVEDEPFEHEEQDEDDGHIEEMLVDDEQDDGSQFDPADLNQDGSVNGADLASLLGQWGNQGGSGDLNDNGFVEGGDLAVLLGRWR